MTGEQMQPISDERLAEIEAWCRVSSVMMAFDFRTLVARMRAAEAEADRCDLLAYRLDAVAEVLADDWDWKAGRSLHDAVSRAIRATLPDEEGDRG